MITCPHCGSSAQVRRTNKPEYSDKERILTETYTCGCGCDFTIKYERIFTGVTLKPREEVRT